MKSEAGYDAIRQVRYKEKRINRKPFLVYQGRNETTGSWKSLPGYYAQELIENGVKYLGVKE